MNAPGRMVLAVAVLAATLVWPMRAVHANDAHGIRGGEEPPTRFERFVLSGCILCVTESHLVATLPMPALKLPAFPRGSPGARAGELRIEALRAYEFGRPSRQSLAMRLTLFVLATSSARSELYQVAVGLLDEDEVAILASAVTEIASLASAAPVESGAESIDTSFRGGSVRIGLLQFKGEAVAYVQAGNLQTVAVRPIWEAPITMYLSPGELPTLANAIGQLVTKVRQLRGL